MSHLLFADDSLLLFRRANRENAEVVRDVMNLYCHASGQQINLEKSSVHFAKGCSAGVRGEIKGILESPQ